MKHKYHIYLLGCADAFKTTFAENLWKAVEELGLSQTLFELRGEDDFLNRFRGDCPSFAIYYGDSAPPISHTESLSFEINKAGISVLPIYTKKDYFKQQIPDFLHHYNGLLLGNEIDKVVHIILEEFRLLRQNRRIFISYKRDESKAVAQQLHTILLEHQFSVFLDTHSVRPSKKFQEELWHHLIDSDLLIMLHSPNFDQSNWCMQEIERASKHKIGVIQILWPDITSPTHLELCEIIQLSARDFVKNTSSKTSKTKLKQRCLTDICNNIESIRARNVAARHNEHVSFCQRIAQESSTTKSFTIDDVNFLGHRYIKTIYNLYIPIIGVPTSVDYHHNHKLKLDACGASINTVYMIYDADCIKEKWVEHLEWLNGYQDVKAINTTEFISCLKKN